MDKSNLAYSYWRDNIMDERLAGLDYEDKYEVYMSWKIGRIQEMALMRSRCVKATRYEFGGIGIFHALEILEGCEMKKSDEDDLEYAIKGFEKELDVPDELAPENKNKLISFFTEEGLKTFKDYIDIIYNLFVSYAESAGFGETEEVILDIPKECIVYSDEYQLLINEEDYKKIKESL